MTFHLEPPYKYEHLKLWFKENYSRIPESLVIKNVPYTDVKKAVDVAICSIDAHIASGNRPNETVKTYKNRLILIYEAIKSI